MIFGNIQNLKEYAFLEDAVKECFDYAGSHDLKAYEKGSHEIDGKRLFVNIVEYQTVEAEKRFWEAHREYLDIHLMLEGSERVEIAPPAELTEFDRMEANDFYAYRGEGQYKLVLSPGDFLVVFPNDAHRIKMQVSGPETVSKAVFKVRIKESEGE